MAFISEEEINNIREASDIVEIISDYVPLKKAGNDYVGVCPFHEDHSPSMHVSPRLGIFKCFVCNTGGNVFSFVSKYENVSYPESIKIVAEKSGISFNHSISKDVPLKYKKEFDLMDLSLKYYQNNINSENGLKAKDYLHKRGITEDIIKEFKIGLSFDDNGLVGFLNNKKEDLNLASSLGLLIKNGIDFYDTFENRIMIPIYNMQGNLAGYTGRCYLLDEKSKYINSKETVIYKKSNILFNFYNAKEYIKKEKEIIIVEGNMDAIKMSSMGIKNVVALMGVVISPYQVEEIKKLNCRVVLMLDSDNAGSIATKSVGDEIYKSIKDLYVVRLSGAKDPDEYVEKYGVEKLKNNISHAGKYLTFKINELKDNKNLEDFSTLTEYVEDVIKVLNDVNDLERDIIISKIASENNIDPNIIKNRLNPIKKEKANIVVKKPKKTKYDLVVSKLLYALLLNKDYYLIFMNHIGYLNNKEERDYLSLVGSYIKKNGNIKPSAFLDYIEKYPEVKKLAENIISDNNEENIEEKQFYDILAIASKEMGKEEINKIKENIKNETDIAKKLELMERLTELKKEGSSNEGN